MQHLFPDTTFKDSEEGVYDPKDSKFVLNRLWVLVWAQLTRRWAPTPGPTTAHHVVKKERAQCARRTRDIARQTPSLQALLPHARPWPCAANKKMKATSPAE